MTKETKCETPIEKEIRIRKAWEDSNEVTRFAKRLARELPIEAFRNNGAFYLSDGIWILPDGTRERD